MSSFQVNTADLSAAAGRLAGCDADVDDAQRGALGCQGALAGTPGQVVSAYESFCSDAGRCTAQASTVGASLSGALSTAAFEYLAANVSAARGFNGNG